MAATYKRVPRTVPSSERSMTITSVVAGDDINISAILGRPANRIKIIPDDATDSISIRINNRLRLKTYNGPGDVDEGYETAEPVYVVTHSDTYPLYVLTGSSQYYTEEGLRVSHISVEDITFGSGGTSITIYCW